MSAVIGIDPSLTATGVATTLGLHTILTTPRTDRRLNFIHDSIVEAIIQEAELALRRSDVLAVLEDLPQHAHSAGLTGMAQGAIRCALEAFNIIYVTVTPATLKKYATGRGNATKADMRVALLKRTGRDVRDDNQVDAWWLRAAGMQHLGSPVVDLPTAQIAALDKVQWP